MTFVVGVAGAGDDPVDLLARLAGVFVDDGKVRRLLAAGTAAELRDVLAG